MVEMLLPFLDLESTSILAQCQELTRQVLQGSYVWNRLVKSSRLSDGVVFFWFLDNGLFQEMVRQVNHLVAILKLLEDPTDNLENLLDAICQRCSEEEVTRLSHLGSVKIHGPTSPESCQVLFSDFLLLEAVEGGLGTAVQVVEEIVSTSKPLKEPILSSLASRLSRQQKKIALFDCLTVHVDNIESAEAFKTLMEATSDYLTPSTGLEVVQPIGDKGWKLLSEAKKASPKLLLNNLIVVKDNLHEADVEDFKVLWDALIQGGRVRVCDKYFPNFLDDVEKTENGVGWTRLFQIMKEKVVSDNQ